MTSPQGNVTPSQFLTTQTNNTTQLTTLFNALSGYVKTEAFTITSGSVYDTLLGTPIVSSTGRCVSFVIPTGVAKIFVTGRSITTNVGLYALLDVNNNVISSFSSGATNIDYKYYEINIPSNAVKLLVNSNQYGFVINIQSFNPMTSDKLSNILDQTSFTLNKYDVSGSIGTDGSNGNTWACAQKLISVGNTKTLYLYHTSNYDVDLLFYKYDLNEVAISISTDYLIKPNTIYAIDTTGLTYIRLSFNLKNSSNVVQVIDFSSFNLTVMLDFYDYTTNVVRSLSFESVPRTDFGNNLVVGTSGTADYTDIGTAYNIGAKNNALYIKNGIYEGYLSLASAFITGESRELTVIRNSAAVYPYSALSANSGLIENVTFYATNSVSTNSTYAVHIENDLTANQYLKFRNCRFISDYNAAVGIGMRVGFVLEFENCEFVSNALNPSTGLPDAHGAVFFHDSITSTLLGLQYIIFKNCVFESAWENALAIQSVNSANTLVATFINCNLYSTAYGDKNVVRIRGGAQKGFLCGNSVLLSKRSHGNNIDTLNAY